MLLLEAGPDYGAFDAGEWAGGSSMPARPDTHDWGYSRHESPVAG
ncbi:MAG: hypothetical protein R2849_01080 [Thermomicrobiales bacterium]